MIQMEAVFQSAEIVFFNETFILASGKGFWLITNLSLLFREFFCQLTPFLKLNVAQFLKKNFKIFIFFGLVETEFSSNPSSRLVYTNFGPISNHVLLFRAFFSCWKASVKLDVNQFFRFFSVPNSRSSFSGQCKQILYRMLFIPTSGNGFSVQCSFIQSKFRASGNHY